MPTRNKNANRQRTKGVRVMVTRKEHDELQAAADQSSMALSVFIRVAALKEARLQRPQTPREGS